MTINDKIRAALRECGTPMNLDQLTEANGWDKVDRHQAGKNLWVLRNNGELVTTMSEGRVCYGLAPDFTPRYKRRVAANAPQGAAKDADNASQAYVRVAREHLKEYEQAEQDAVKVHALAEARDKVKAEARVRGDVELRVSLSAPAVDALDQLLASGFYGADRAAVAQSLLYQRLHYGRSSGK